MKKISKFILITSLAFFSPMITLAADASTTGGFTGIVSKISSLLSSILPLLVSLGVIYFIWGVIQYVIGNSEEAKKKGKDHIIYGIIGLVVIISIWGLVFLITDAFGLTTNGAIKNAPTDVSNLVVQVSDNTCTMGTNVQGVLKYFTCIIGNSVIPAIFALAVVMFMWGAVKFFIINSDEEAKRAQGKQFMIWGIIALTVMIGVWGLVGIVGETFGIKNALPSVSPNSSN